MTGQLILSTRSIRNFLWVALVWLFQAQQITCSFLSTTTVSSRSQTASPLSTKHTVCKPQLGSRQMLFASQSSPFPWERPLPSDGDEEETLLRLHLSVQPNIDVDEALIKVQRFTQSFPFAAILPVQPLQYLPTHDGGVDVLFLRKKTEEKGSVDGGIRFFVRLDDGNDLGGGIEVLAKRNSQGQIVGKMFSERLVIQAYVKGVSGEERKLYGSPPDNVVTISSVFHKWM